MANKQSLSNVKSGKDITQHSDAPSSEQSMQEIRAEGKVSQTIATNKDQESLSLLGFGRANGKIAVGLIVAAFLFYLIYKVAIS